MMPLMLTFETFLKQNTTNLPHLFKHLKSAQMSDLNVTQNIGRVPLHISSSVAMTCSHGPVNGELCWVDFDTWSFI